MLSSRYPALHGLRVIAIFLVIESHVASLLCGIGDGQGVPPHYDSFYQVLCVNSWFAMDLFFIMSGLLIGQILMHMKERPRVSGQWFRFYARRAFRTLPLYYTVLFAYFVMRVLFDKNAAPPRIFLQEYFFLTNYTSEFYRLLMPWSWSLSIEEHFYLACPIVVYILYLFKTHRTRLLFLTALWSCGFLVRLLLYFRFPNANYVERWWRVFTPTHARFDIFIAGIWLAYLIQHFEPRLRKFYQLDNVRNGSLVIGLGFLVLFLIDPGIGFHPLLLSDSKLAPIIDVFYFGTFSSLAFAPLILWSVFTDNAVTRLMGARPVQAIATLGYAIYLVHLPVCAAVRGFVMKNFPADGRFFVLHALILALSCVFVTILAYILHLFIDKPFLWLRDRLT